MFDVRFRSIHRDVAPPPKRDVLDSFRNQQQRGARRGKAGALGGGGGGGGAAPSVKRTVSFRGGRGRTLSSGRLNVNGGVG